MALLLLENELYDYTDNLQNSGISQRMITSICNDFLICFFGRDSAINIIDQIKLNAEGDYGALDSFFNGDGVLFFGVKQAMAYYVEINVISDSNIRIGRSNTIVNGDKGQLPTLNEKKNALNNLIKKINNELKEISFFLKNESVLGISLIKHYMPISKTVTRANRPMFYNYGGNGNRRF